MPNPAICPPFTAAAGSSFGLAVFYNDANANPSQLWQTLILNTDEYIVLPLTTWLRAWQLPQHNTTKASALCTLPVTVLSGFR